MTKIPYLQQQWMVAEYQKDHPSFDSLAQKYKCNQKDIRRTLARHGVLENPYSEKGTLTDADIIKMYTEANMTLEEIGVIYGCSREKIRLRLKQHGIHHNGQRTFVRTAESEERVVRAYLEQEWSIQKIASEFHCSTFVVGNILDAHSIVRGRKGRKKGKGIIMCAECGEEKEHFAHDYCRTCYHKLLQRHRLGTSTHNPDICHWCQK